MQGLRLAEVKRLFFPYVGNLISSSYPLLVWKAPYNPWLMFSRNCIMTICFMDEFRLDVR